MNTKGMYYIKANIASMKPYFWMQPAQNWTSNAQDASFWEDEQKAIEEAAYAAAYGDNEVQVLQATRDI